MEFSGQAIQVSALGDGIYEVCFNLAGESVNKFNQTTLNELKDVAAGLTATAGIRGVLFSSAKDVFIVGADITEFNQMFSASEDEIRGHIAGLNAIFNSVEDLPCPTVVAINGIALGGGFEMCLSCDFRVMSESARVGLPEVKLGIYPGWGGTVRLPRLIGADNAIEWICTGAEKRADAAFKDGAVDAVVSADKLRDAALDLLQKAIAGEFSHNARRQEKQNALPLSEIEKMMVFESAKGVVGAKAGPHYPAPMEVIATIQKAARHGRDKALDIESKGFAKLAKTSVTAALVGLFLKDQFLKKQAKAYEASAQPVKQAAVLGAGIMGGGVAYQSAVKGTPIIMKDIAPKALELGLSEANKLLLKQVEREKITAEQMARTLNQITPALSYGEFGHVDLVVEAVVENPKVKSAVLAEVEGVVRDDAILTSNTSTISISLLAQALKRPENFCGMHFFNPVHRMPLVEVIRGEKTSEKAVATTVAYARAMGKTPIVVNDCPGFLVNRILFPYFAGFSKLMADGADFRQVDKVMEGFGWPMGPAYLLDVVGIDTACHADKVMAAGFPDRMAHEGTTVIEKLYELGRYGQKNSQGFYVYKEDKRGKPKKVVDEAVFALLRDITGEQKAFEADDIIARMMIPMCIETARCLEDGIVSSAAEADMGLIYGIGFPPFRGGALQYIDAMGMAAFVELASRYAHLGKLYQPTERMLQMAQQGETYYPAATPASH
ncbi:fatty acid oxidation complex subunit alpha FadB [Pokkaliibacter sp. MBI-7]|uniref:fatty acid oxidation complex subunit alpha FadB n=1 Tax=Pokkaliibacter sp. MBI-7 TaxID=3040600 RepID=UPI0024483F7E|nr:fatty acid oxidation complex subunit alpha FadB [Pokkaliibacter sp. MBI-7]MDH2433901.1 fatty acid oxidation complex subunit alpha FadB [Pokkaliibacter sp. MBI-7]